MRARAPSGGAAASALALAAGLGVAGDALLWKGPVGPGPALWVALLAGAALLLRRRPGVVAGGSTRAVAAWAVVAVAAAAGTAWRATPPLRLLFLGVLVLSAAGVMLEARGRRFGRTRVADHLWGAALVPAVGATGAIPLFLRAKLPELGRDRNRALAFGRGLLLALPPTAVFLALFAAADPVIERALLRATAIGSEDLPAHVALALATGWLGAGLLRGVLPGPRRNPLATLRPPRVGIEETAMVLGLVTALFAGFVALQLGYLFGGRATLEAVTGLTLAEYARRGFFELVAAAGLVLALLLAMAAAAPRHAGRWVFRALGGALVALVLVVIVSAALRLRLYVAEYGLTTSRFYGAAFMAWLTVTLLWLAVTVLRGRPRPFASGAHAMAVAAVFVLGALNPDALIARTNLDRAGVRAVDGWYLATLSDDAVPTLLARLDEVDVGRCRLALELEARLRSPRDGDWRTWSRGEARARAAIQWAAPDLARVRLATCRRVQPPIGPPVYYPDPPRRTRR